MIVKFFSNKGGGSPKASLDYLQDKKDGMYRVMQGDPNLSLDIANNLDFENNYTVGCLSFEEEPDHLNDEQKREIMERFESTMFAGLEPDEQYNICWIEHSDKGRLELNFFIPNVELTSGKHLQPYYDKADRPLTENFKQVINYEYELTDPNAPEKKQTLITRQDLPSDKKQALELINNYIEDGIKQGEIKDRKDIINKLENAGFEVARHTKKNISIKTDGQNLRLKGAIYEQDFRASEDLREEITRRASEHRRGNRTRYKQALSQLERFVDKRREKFAGKYQQRHHKNEEMARLQPDNANHSINNTRDSGELSVLQDERTRATTHDKICEREVQQVQSNERRSEPERVQQRENVRTDRSEKQNDMDRQETIQDDTNKRGIGKNEQGNERRATFNRYLDRTYKNVRKVAERAVEAFSEIYREFTSRVQSNGRGKQANEQTDQAIRERAGRTNKKLGEFRESVKNFNQQIPMINKSLLSKRNEQLNKERDIRRSKSSGMSM